MMLRVSGFEVGKKAKQSVMSSQVASNSKRYCYVIYQYTYTQEKLCSKITMEAAFQIVRV